MKPTDVTELQLYKENILAQLSYSVADLQALVAKQGVDFFSDQEIKDIEFHKNLLEISWEFLRRKNE